VLLTFSTAYFMSGISYLKSDIGGHFIILNSMCYSGLTLIR